MSLQFTILLCILSMITQGYHSFYTFHKTSNIEGFMGYVQSILFVVVFELFTLYYLVRGKKMMAGFYSVCYLIMNLFYYYNHFQQSGEVYWTSLFLAFIIPFSIFNLAENIPIEMKAIETQKDLSNFDQIMEDKIGPIRDQIKDIMFKKNWDDEIENNPVKIKKEKKI